MDLVSVSLANRLQCLNESIIRDSSWRLSEAPEDWKRTYVGPVLKKKGKEIEESRNLNS